MRNYSIYPEEDIGEHGLPVLYGGWHHDPETGCLMAMRSLRRVAVIDE